MVSKGETILITLRRIPVAELVRSEDGEPKDPKKLVREIRQGASLGVQKQSSTRWRMERKR
ncbi:MAG TPA: hypothetical protein VIH75_14635 [Candidatus Sulfotelmatobacter sp.]|jgi:hypothetical protein